MEIFIAMLIAAFIGFFGGIISTLIHKSVWHNKYKFMSEQWTHVKDGLPVSSKTVSIYLVTDGINMWVNAWVYIGHCKEDESKFKWQECDESCGDIIQWIPITLPDKG